MRLDVLLNKAHKALSFLPSCPLIHGLDLRPVSSWQGINPVILAMPWGMFRLRKVNMVSPVTGPYYESLTLKGPPNSFGFRPDWNRIDRSWYRQSKPYSLELPYTVYKAQVIKFYGGDGTDYVHYYTRTGANPPSSYSQRLYNTAFASYAEALRGVRATLGATLGEWKSSLSMISTRANQLVAGFRAAKRGDISGLKRAWGKHSGIRRRVRASGGHVLEYSFGWAPLVSDINSALEVLHNRLPKHRVRVKKNFSGKVYVKSNLGAVSRVSSTSYTLGVSIRARVGINNPNTALAEQLGLVNLAGVVWELTPNSYVIDYFVNAGNFLGSFTAEVGLDVTDKFHTLFTDTTYNVRSIWNSPFDRLPDYPGYSPPGWAIKEISVNRVSGIPGPTLGLNLPWQLSPQRALTSIARLLQQFKGK